MHAFKPSCIHQSVHPVHPFFPSKPPPSPRHLGTFTFLPIFPARKTDKKKDILLSFPFTLHPSSWPSLPGVISIFFCVAFLHPFLPALSEALVQYFQRPLILTESHFIGSDILWAVFGCSSSTAIGRAPVTSQFSCNFAPDSDAGYGCSCTAAAITVAVTITIAIGSGVSIIVVVRGGSGARAPVAVLLLCGRAIHQRADAGDCCRRGVCHSTTSFVCTIGGGGREVARVFDFQRWNCRAWRRMCGGLICWA